MSAEYKSPKERATELASEMERLASLARARAEEHRQAELAAFMSDDQGSAEAHAAHEMVARGKALAYEDAEVLVRLLATWIPEETS